MSPPRTRAQGKRRTDPPVSPAQQAFPSSSNVRLEHLPAPVPVSVPRHNASLRRLLNDEEHADDGPDDPPTTLGSRSLPAASPQSHSGSQAGSPLPPGVMSPLSPLPPSGFRSSQVTPRGSSPRVPIGGGGSVWSGILGSNASAFNARQGRLSAAPLLSGATPAQQMAPPSISESQRGSQRPPPSVSGSQRGPVASASAPRHGLGASAPLSNGEFPLTFLSTSVG